MKMFIAWVLGQVITLIVYSAMIGAQVLPSGMSPCKCGQHRFRLRDVLFMDEQGQPVRFVTRPSGEVQAVYETQSAGQHTGWRPDAAPFGSIGQSSSKGK